jgi:restriction endonuclease
MKLKFKHQSHQTDAVKAVVDCFAGQPMSRGFKYAIDPGRVPAAGAQAGLDKNYEPMEQLFATIIERSLAAS